MKNLRVALGQMVSTDNATENIKQMLQLLTQVPEGTKLVSFPENCLFFRMREGEALPHFSLEDPIFAPLIQMAKQKNLHIHLGSVPTRIQNENLSSSVLIAPDGLVTSNYAKVHLFDISLEGQPPVRESDFFSNGKAPGVIEVGEWKIGQSICYDLRFSELYSFYAGEAVSAILIPSAFLVKTGEAHWEVLVRARAIESQCYVLAAGQAGIHRGKNGGERRTFGRSMIVDPWGKILKESPREGTDLLVYDLDAQFLAGVRKQIPMHNHRRLLK